MKEISRQVNAQDLHIMVMLGIFKYHENQYKKYCIIVMDIYMRLVTHVP